MPPKRLMVTVLALSLAVSLAACGAGPTAEVSVLREVLSSMEEAGVPVHAVYHAFCDDPGDCRAGAPADSAAASIRDAVPESVELVAAPPPAEEWPLCPWVQRSEEEETEEGFLLGFSPPAIEGDTATVLTGRSCRSPTTTQVDRFRLHRDPDDGSWRVVAIERRPDA